MVETYRQIKEYVKRKYGYNVETCWIAHAKELCGIPVEKSPRRSGERKKPCPQDKIDAIKDAFRNFGSI